MAKKIQIQPTTFTQYDSIRDFCEGLAAVQLGDYETGKRGFIDRQGKEVIPLKYSGRALLGRPRRSQTLSQLGLARGPSVSE